MIFSITGVLEQLRKNIICVPGERNIKNPPSDGDVQAGSMPAPGALSRQFTSLPRLGGYPGRTRSSGPEQHAAPPQLLRRPCYCSVTLQMPTGFLSDCHTELLVITARKSIFSKHPAKCVKAQSRLSQSCWLLRSPPLGCGPAPMASMRVSCWAVLQGCGLQGVEMDEIPAGLSVSCFLPPSSQNSRSETLY